MAPPACKGAAVAATEWHRRLAWLRRAAQVLGPLLKGLGLAGGALLAHPARAVDLPEDRAEAMFHAYNGGGVRATGPALLVRKSLADKVSLSGSLYVDAVSNASIDVVTTASPYRESRTEWAMGLDYARRDTSTHLNFSRSTEPDYTSTTGAVDISQEVFGGMSTVSLGFSRGQDDVGKHNDLSYTDQARHWNYRLGLTQILSPRWIASVNAEAIADDGFLGSPYRVARVFGSAVPERLPRTRSARALKFRVVGDVGEAGTRSAVRAEYRYYRDTWAIQAHTLEGGYTRYFGDRWLADGFVRLNRQGDSLFYSDNAASETLYVTRNRQLSAFTSTAVGAKASYALSPWLKGLDLKLNGSIEAVRFNYSHFTDIRTGQRYSFTGQILQVYLSGTF